MQSACVEGGPLNQKIGGGARETTVKEPEKRLKNFTRHCVCGAQSCDDNQNMFFTVLSSCAVIFKPAVKQRTYLVHVRHFKLEHMYNFVLMQYRVYSL